MKKKTIIFLAAMVLGGTACFLFFYVLGEPYRLPALAFKGDSTDLNDTVIVPTLDTPMPKGKNVIWCSSFQIAWNKLKDDVIKAPIRVENAEEVARRLNAAPQTAKDLPDGSYYAVAGFVKDGIVDLIKKEMQARFQRRPQLDENYSPEEILAYTYLEANVKFKIPFFERREPLMFKDSKGRETAVSGFGAGSRYEDAKTSSEIRDQVEILYSVWAKDSKAIAIPDEFILDPCRYTSPIQIILACVKPVETLADTLADMEKKISAAKLEDWQKYLGSEEILFVPDIFYKVTHRFKELEGQDKIVLNKGFESYFIDTALQIIEFRLDRSGAELKSEAKTRMKSCAPRYFIFNHPFLIYMKKRGAAHPFFVMWIDNAELLSKF